MRLAHVSDLHFGAEVPAAALPARLRWLILTDNAIESLPPGWARFTRLQKLMLAGNRLRALPDDMAGCAQLELLRIAANRFEALPPWLLRMPRLAWLACGGNPFSEANEATALASARVPTSTGNGSRCSSGSAKAHRV